MLKRDEKRRCSSLSLMWKIIESKKRQKVMGIVAGSLLIIRLFSFTFNLNFSFNFPFNFSCAQDNSSRNIESQVFIDHIYINKFWYSRNRGATAV